jgi:hypothetical protein
MSTIVTRAGKGSALTHTEVDANFTNLNNDKLQSGNTAAALTITNLSGTTVTYTNANISSATISGGTITGITDLAIVDGGTGASTAQAAINALVASVTSGSYLRGNGTNVVMSTIQVADVPTLNQNTTGTASNVTGTVAIANGGTGQTTDNAAFNALAPSQTGNSGKYLTTNGTNTSWATISSAGTVTSVAATVPSFLSVSGSPITTSGTLAISYSGTALPVANGGTGITSFGSGVATWLGTPSSANLAAAVTGETGSGALVFGTSPTLTTPNINSAQVATVSGTAPLYMCRAWVNFNGTGTVAIRASGNVSSITDNGVGDYTVNFTTAMPDVNYSVTGNAMRNQAAGNNLTAMSIYPSTTYSDAFAAGSFRTRTQDYAGGAQDPLAVTVAIFR